MFVASNEQQRTSSIGAAFFLLASSMSSLKGLALEMRSPLLQTFVSYGDRTSTLLTSVPTNSQGRITRRQAACVPTILRDALYLRDFALLGAECL